MSTLNLDLLLTNNASPPVATDADSTPVLSDAAGTFGVKREDTAVVVVPAYDAVTHPASIFTRRGTGSYRYALAGAIPGVSYRFAYKVVAGGNTRYVEKVLTATLGLDSDESYLTVAAADAIANSLPGLTYYKAAGGANKAAALLLASIDVDNDQIYQGQKFTLTQLREFPRMAYQSTTGISVPPILDFDPTLPQGYSADVVWDWDANSGAAVVPDQVLQAVMFQADDILNGSRDGRLQAIADGLISQTTGPFAEAYKASARPSSLCRRASMLMNRYALRQGRML